MIHSSRIDANPLDTNSLALAEIHAPNNGPAKLPKIERTSKLPIKPSTRNILPPKTTNNIGSTDRNRDRPISITGSLIASELGGAGWVIGLRHDSGHVPLCVPAWSVQGD